MIFLSLAEAAVRLWTTPMPCSPSLIRFWPPTAQRLFRVWASTPTSAFSTAPGPGARSLALDLMEELRTVYADRFVLSCINQKIMTPKHFQKQENGAVLLTDEGRRAFLGGWQTRKQETITHPFLNEKLPWASCLMCRLCFWARTLRGDMELYPPFFWK